jgi:hypothetical protein
MKPIILLLAGLVCLTARAADPVVASNAPARLVIVKAVYGDPNDASATIDVTKQVAVEVKGDAITMRAGNENFEDPASGANKALKVDYTIDGVAGKKTVYENGLLRLSVADKPDPAKKTSSKLVIRKALYGDLPEGNANDVTADIAALVRDDALTVKASNDDFGDPQSGRPKKLRVDYAFEGKEKSKMVSEGETLTVSAGGE